MDIVIGQAPAVVSLLAVEPYKRRFGHFVEDSIFGVDDKAVGRDPCGDGAVKDAEEVLLEKRVGDALYIFYQMLVHTGQPLLGLFRYYNTKFSEE